MHPMDVSGRTLLAHERYDGLERDARPALRRAGRTRSAWAVLVAAGLRLAPECAPGRGAVA